MARREPRPASTRARRPVTPFRRALAATRLALIVVGLAAAVITFDLNLRTLLENGPSLRRATPRLDLPYLGMTVDWTDASAAQRRADMARLAENGVGWIRLRVDWAPIEAAPGVYVWDAVDAAVADIIAAGRVPMLVLNGSPAWARAPRDRMPVDNPHAPPADFTTFAEFSAAVAQRYGEQVRFYQIWDEPNIAPHWGDRHVEPVHYAQLLRLSAAAVRAADPDAQIISAALAPTRDRGHTAMDEVRFLQRMLAAGARGSLDAVAVQPLGFGATPQDARRRVEVLNAQRAALIRRALAAAGADDLPVIAVRFGWNDRPHAPWRTVLEPTRTQFAQESLTLARREWPWLAAAGWAIDRPAVPPDDPMWGFATDSALLAALDTGAHAEPSASSKWPNRTPWLQLGFVLAVVAVGSWRAGTAATVAGWHTGIARLRESTAWQVALWASLLAAYHAAVWPPLVVALLAAAAVLIWVRPQSAILAAAFFLPLHIYHKEFHFASGTVTLPPAQAVLVAALPLLAATLRRAVSQRPWRPRLSGLDGPALAWLVLGMLAVNVWHWPGYVQGTIDLVVAPLLLYALIRLFAQERSAQLAGAVALFAGGVLAALIGLVSWSGGAGTVADGFRRLVGPHFSPNHTALYLERTLFLGLGLFFTATAFRPGQRWISIALGSALVVVAGALVLTASRGALVLALPAGVVSFGWAAARRGRGWHGVTWRGRWWLVGLALVLAVVGLTAILPRAANTATMVERFAIWAATLDLWRSAPVFGVGAGGFYWTFPAHIPVQAAIDPNLRHPHNVWLEVLTGWGVLGGLWLGWLLAQWWRTGQERHGVFDGKAAPWLAVGLTTGLVAGLAHGQVDAFLTLPDLAAWNWAAFALLAGLSQTKRPPDVQVPSGGPSKHVERLD
jgi:O-antigen ligase